MRQEKGLLKQAIQEKIHQHPSFVIMQYAKMNANTANLLRRQVRKSGGDVEVLSKRLFLKSVNELGIAIERAVLDGHIGLIFLGKDPIESVKAVFKFSQEKDNIINILGGRFDGALYSGEDVDRLSKLPGKDEMRALFLSTLEAPMSQTLAVIEALLTSVPFCLENKAKEGTEEAS